MNKLIKFPLILALTGTICATALGVVYQIANPIIEERVNAAANEAIGAVLPGAKGSDITKKYASKKALMTKYKVSTIYEVKQDGKDVGYGYKVASTGFGGDIESLVLLDNAKILGVKVLNHKETKAKFDLILNANFENNFANLEIGKIESVANVSGASVSSMGIKSGIMQAVNAHKEIVLGQTIGPVEVVKPEDFVKLGYEGSTFEDATEQFKTTQGDRYESKFVPEGITNAYYRKDASGNTAGYVYYCNPQYKFEVGGVQVKQDMKFLFAIDTDGTNSKLVVLESNDSMADIPDFVGNSNFMENEFISNFNGKTLEDFKTNMPDKISKATFTSNALIGCIRTISARHKSF